ncbi:MAG: FtsK/SpoIIIE domain-containing protein [Alkalilacustris sp.]
MNVSTTLSEVSVSDARRGDLIARVVWGIVLHAVKEAAAGQRVTFMLVGLTAEALEGIARNKPADLHGRSLLLKMNPKAAPRMQVHEDYLSDESAVHWRHNDAAEVIVFAPSDAEREGIGAGLGPISRIDEPRIIDQIEEAWVAELGETGEANSYLREALKGLRDAREVCLDLQMWVDFIFAIFDQQFDCPVDIRIKRAMPALRIPLDGIVKLPAFKSDGNPKARARDFAAAFRYARLEAGVYATLMTPKHERVDVSAVRRRVAEFQRDNGPEVIDALDAVRALLDDADHVRPGGWLPSQEAFCRKVSWERVGIYVFEGKSGGGGGGEGLGLRTLRFLEGDYSFDITKEDRDLLENLPDRTPRPPRDVEVEFFNRWQERLQRNGSLFKAWQKRLFAKDVSGQDLCSTFAEGFEALIAAGGPGLEDMQAPRILIRAAQHDKASYWEGLDREIKDLFLFELNCMGQLFDPFVVWDLEAARKHVATSASGSAEARKVELELYLVEESQISDLASMRSPPSQAARVRATWQPGKSPKDEPISLALLDDLDALAKAAAAGDSLFRPLNFAPRSSGEDTRLSSTSLFDRNSFSDVAQGQQGRTFDLVVRPQEDLLGDLRARLQELERSRTLGGEIVAAVMAATEAFDASYRKAVTQLVEDTSAAFTSRVLEDQAEAFGALCRACRLPATTGRSGQEIRALVAGIGVVVSDGAEPMALLAAWHPLRLAERRAKIEDLASFVEAVLTSRPARSADLSGAFQERRLARSRWAFPEVVFAHGKTMIAVEDLGGYSLMVPADCVARNQEALEASAPSAAVKFMEGVDQYLEIHPHEATNLSAAIFDSESQTLPREVAREMAKRLHRQSDLRCDLVITHRDQDRMRKIYRNQNLRLGAENISETARGFLSRLRVDVRSNRTADGVDSEVRDLDLVFLHDVISHHADPVWLEEAGSSQDLAATFDPAMARRPRRRMTETDASGVGIYLTLPRPPRAVGQYQDLLYELAKGFLPEGFHGVLIRQVQFADAKVGDLVRRAHQLAEWVITYDKVASRTLFERCGVQIISDISVPGADGRVIISAGKVDDRLKRNVRDDLIAACGIAAPDAERLAGVVIRDVLRISGQKVLSAARYTNASREMIGLAVMRAWMEGALKGTMDEAPIWVSLDDYRGWFMSEKGRVADAIAVTIDHDDGAFRVLLQVGEAKFVEKTSELATIREAQQQVQDTVDRLVRLFIDNDDVISRAAACARLADLLVNRDGVTERLPDPVRRAAFFNALSAGEVSFQISGEAVVCLHDDHGPVWRCEADPDRPHLRHHVLTTPAIRQTLQRTVAGELPERDSLGDIDWYGEGDVRKPRPVLPPAATTVVVGEHTSAPEDLTAEGPAVSQDTTEAADTAGAEPEAAPAEVADSGLVPEPPRFLPPPVFAVLRDMAASERGAVTDAESLAWADRMALETQRALSHFSMQAEFADPKPRLTPNGALIAFRGHPSLTVDKIEKRTSELLTTYGIEVSDVRPGRGRISVFVTREKRARVPLASTWLGALWPDRDPGQTTSFILGAREDEDRLLYMNLAEPFADYDAHGPHTLIAGETGSGKGILTQGILLQLIAFNDPEQAELIVVDPKKGVDFSWLEGAPQMKAPIVTEMSAAQAILEDLVVQMDARYDLLRAAGAANISEYNRKVAPEQRMSRIFLVHDELGAWMAQEKEYQEVVLSSVANLGMKARAAGIHLTLITQRADADAVPGRLRDNMGNRLCLKVQNGTGSRMVLGVGGAEKLLGKGHLACVLANQQLPAGQEFFVVQVPFAETEDMHRLAHAAKSYWASRRG